jgi:predicted DNA-binding transcriptional regulator YafY
MHRTYERLRTERVRNCARLRVPMDTPARLLRLLVLFSARAAWRADELAERLEVTERTLRRDVVRLRELGYPIEGTTGPYGGYALGAGGRMPPLLLDDDEAVAVSVGLREASHTADPMIADAAMSALTKLAQVLPSGLRERVDTLGEMTVGFGATGGRFSEPTSSSLALRGPDGRDRVSGSHTEQRPPERAPATRAAMGQAPQAPRGRSPQRMVGVLMTLAAACRRERRMRFDYTTGDDRTGRRHVDPHRLVSLRRRWYLVAFDLDRDDWRTFRIDRITGPVETGARCAVRDAPDPAALVSEGVAVRAYDVHARIRMLAPRSEVAEVISPSVGVIEQTGDGATETFVRMGGDPDWIARYVAGLPFPCEVLEPPEVRKEVRTLARRLLQTHRP